MSTQKPKREPPVPVIFRIFTEAQTRAGGHGSGQVIALFPTVPASCVDPSIQSYMHVGQHSGASYHGVVSRSRPATPAEYKALEKELKQIGYRLAIKSKVTTAMRREFDREYDKCRVRR